MISTTVLDQVTKARGGCIPLARVGAADRGRYADVPDVRLTFFPGAPGEQEYELDPAEAVALGQALIAAGESAAG